MERLVVSDTNIFIDLVKLGILADFFFLPWEIHTTDYVMDELTDFAQYDAVISYYDRGRLSVGAFTADEVAAIHGQSAQPQCSLSPTDISVIMYAQKTKGCSILTGDRLLRETAQKVGLEVHGILFIFDTLVEHGMLPDPLAAELLGKLYSFNKRLPSSEIEKRINQWKQV